MTNYTPAQLESWAGLGPWESDIDMYRAAPDLARLVLEKDAEIARKDAEIAQLQGQVAWLRSAIDHVVAPSHEGNQ